MTSRTKIERAGHFLVATDEQVASLDLPACVSTLDGKEIPHLYEPQFLNLLISAVLGADEGLRIVRLAGDIVLYRFPEAATDALATLTPDRPDVCMATISAIADRVMLHEEVSSKFKLGGVRAAALIVRGYALKATPRHLGKEGYYAFWRSA